MNEMFSIGIFRSDKSFFNYSIFTIWKVNSNRILSNSLNPFLSLGSTGAYEEFKIRLYTYLEGPLSCERKENLIQSTPM